MIEPDYYNKNELSPLDAMKQGLLSKEEYKGFLKGNIIKYTIRAGEKEDDSTNDINKAITYLNYLHEAIEDDKEEPIGFKEDDTYKSKLDKLHQDILDFKKEYGIK